MKTNSSGRLNLLIGSTAVLLSLGATSVARAQALAAEPPVAPPIPAAPVAATGPETPPAGIEPLYPYGPPPPYYDYAPRYYYPPHYHRPFRYRALPYAYPTPPAPYAYPTPPVVESPEGFHTHDGFYFRFHLGIAGTGFSSTQAGTKTSYSGRGGSGGIALGGAIARNLILYGAAFGTSTAYPDKQVGGVSMPGDVGSIGVGAVGFGLAYYFEEVNLYLAGTVGLAGFAMNDGSGFRIDSSRSGRALELLLGKEWWVSCDWGFGLAGEVFFASLKDRDTPGLTWSAGSAAILLSATYN